MKNTTIFVALDVSEASEALKLVKKLKHTNAGFKIGKQLFTSAGPDIVKAVVDTGKKVFLDLKFHDIPATVARASSAAASLGVYMINVHASGGFEMMQKTREQLNSMNNPPMVVAVTVLTSMNENDLKDIGVYNKPSEQVVNLAKLAEKSGMDGVVASPLEVSLIRENTSSDFQIVTPGIRPEFSMKNDQKRTATPLQAVKNGSNFLVIGRPVRLADNPAAAYEKIIGEIHSG